MKNRKALVVCMFVGICLLLGYVLMRHRDLKKIQAELAVAKTQNNELTRANQEVAKLIGRYGAGADVPAFVEEMHRYARQAGIADDYELSSSQKNSSSGRSGASNQKGVEAALTVSRMRISLHGEYRDIAEYLRLLQEDKNPKKFLDLRVSQEKGVPRLTMNLELYSYRGDNAT